MSDVDATFSDLVNVIVVHFRRHDTVGEVIAGLIAHGVRPERLMVVDNSEMPEHVERLRSGLPRGTHLHVVPNRGYGSAVNDGIVALDDLGLRSPFLLVATHEVLLDADCIPRLVRALQQDSSISAVGPTLRDARQPDRVWSTGGRLSRVVRLPIHPNRQLRDTGTSELEYCDWLDGAIVLYRANALPARPFDESFFLYMEEVDLHLRLGYAGGRIAVVTDASASQHSDGTPMFLFARNLRLLHKRHTSISRRWLSVLYPIGRRAVGAAVRGRWPQVRALLKGLTAKLPQPDRRVVVINPLDSALHHYGEETKALLRQSGVSTDFISFPEPSARSTGRVAWIRDYVSSLGAARRLRSGTTHASVIVLWPVVGFIDLILLRRLVGVATLVIHDPVPLVRAVGYGRVGPIAARRVRGSISMLTHSESARVALAAATSTPIHDIILLPHPMLPPLTVPIVPISPQVVVMGQYKPDRDLELLAAIARDAEPSWNLSIVGRGWPAVPGWTVDSRFVPEAEFEQILRGASVALIPYRRFYQSGVAVRAIELGTPVVGPRDSVLHDVLGDESPWLADDHASWMRAIRSAVSTDPQSIAALQREVYSAVATRWERTLKDMFDGN